MNVLHIRFAALGLIAALVVLVVFAPKQSGARTYATASPAATADFVPPMSQQAADERVRTARADQAQQRAALLKDLPPVTADALPSVQTLYVSQSGYHLSERTGFLDFWRENGGVLLFGYPISEEIVEDGRIVQYFERARFEYHPEIADATQRVKLSLLGTELAAGRSFPAGTPDGGEKFFAETQHTLSGKFLRFWTKRGGLAVFGYPISEPMDETSAVDGQTYRVQYFERARFEFHPGELGSFYQQEEQALGISLAALHEISLGDLGRQAAAKRGHTFAKTTQLQGALPWSPLLWQRSVDVDLSKQRMTAYEGTTPVYSAPVATGKDGFNTPTGTFAIYSKVPMETMSGSAEGETWYVPNIPWAQYIVGGVAFHGTYWHDQWGTGFRLSHGCVNLNIDDAEWLYEWADVGTPVTIHY